MSTDEPSEPEFSLIAGHPALDLCNTVDWRLEPGSRYERLTSYDAALAWARATGVLNAAEAAAVAELTEPAEATSSVRAASLDTAASGAGATSSATSEPSTPRRSAGERELNLLRDLRETTYRLVTERGEADARSVSAMAADAVRTSELTMSDRCWEWRETALTTATVRRPGQRMAGTVP